ncbi:MAG TPA: adenylate/guanylate cyclase domain-containing protein [Stellaceae bacterium]|nr:adenylate/guanylate cyclase domain-containing protein [Stellaceae bacterium]
MDIGVWLRKLGLERYEPAFRENRIDASILPRLTAEDLKELGVAAVGDRRRLLDAIAKLHEGKRARAPESPSDDAASTEDSAHPFVSGAERRQLTVMFCDLVGSTALSARLDPEDMREIIGAYHRCCAEQITTAGGFVAKYMGDGVLAYFGYPQAHEYDAERAVRGALALIEAIPQLRARHDAVLQVRIGIATGLVVVGDLIGEGASQEQGVVGETPNVAARLQVLADPGQAVISHDTRRLTGGMFDYRDLGKVALKGLGNPVQAWQVTSTSALQSRFEAHHESSLTPLIGREEELELLLRRWQKAKSGEGQVVLLSGEPGIGKSRLTVALSERLQSEPHTRVRYFCSPHHTDSALYPTITQLERAAGFERDEAPEAKLGKIGALVGPSSGHENDIQLLCELLSIPTGNRYAPLSWSPQRKKEKTFEALLGQLEMLGRPQPVLVAYEDVHWIDPSSRELLDMTVERVMSLPVLLIITFRPEFQPPWTGQAHVSVLSLNRLGRREGAALVERVAENKALPDEIRAEIVERTDGVPLFVEELTKAVLESGGTVVLGAASHAAQSVPATLYASLMARLDRLGPASKETAQIGAVLGREFSHELIEAVAQRPDRELQAALTQLSDAGLLFCRGTAPHASYLFKHALVQDAAYQSLLRGRRHQLHARIADALERRRIVDPTAARPEIVGHHLNEAGFAERAIACFREAAREAAERWANAEAVRHLSRARELAGQLSDELARKRTELAVLLELGPVLTTVRGFTSPEVEEVYTSASVLCGDGGDPAQQFAAAWGLWFVNNHRGRFDAARRWADELMDLARASQQQSLLLQAHHSAWTTWFVLGDDRHADSHVQQGIRLYDIDEHRAHAARYGGHDPGVCARMIGGMAAWFLGFPERSGALSAAAIELGQRLSDPFSSATALSFGVAMMRREPELVKERVAALERLLDTHALALGHYRSTAKMLRGWAATVNGTPDEGRRLAQEGLMETRRTGFARVSFQLGLMAEVYRLVGEGAIALDTVTEAMRVGEAQGETRWHSHLLHEKGRVLASLGETQGAEEALRAALDAARGQGARSPELRASTSLARLWRDQGKRSEARELLAPIYGWFTEGFDTPDLKEAKALLEELG